MALWKFQPSSAPEVLRPALFLDRDGVVIADRHYLADPEQVEVLPGVAAAMLRAREAGFWLVGVSNQSGLGRGRITEDQFEQVMRRLDQLLATDGVSFDAFLYCPHAPQQHCPCRKPKPGLLQEATALLNWSASGSWVIGDKSSDVALGRQAGLGSVLVRTGYGLTQQEEVLERWRDDPLVRVVDDLPAGVRGIVEGLFGVSGS